MNVTLEREKISEATWHAAILALQPHERMRLLTALLEQLTPDEQIQVAIRLPSGAAPITKAAIMNQAVRATKGAPKAGVLDLIDSWRTSPLLDDDESSWQEIMENLETHRRCDLV